MQSSAQIETTETNSSITVDYRLSATPIEIMHTDEAIYNEVCAYYSHLLKSIKLTD